MFVIVFWPTPKSSQGWVVTLELWYSIAAAFGGAIATELDNKINALDTRLNHQVDAASQRLENKIDGDDRRLEDKANEIEQRLNFQEFIS